MALVHVSKVIAVKLTLTMKNYIKTDIFYIKQIEIACKYQDKKS